jgi:hypothetical protein
MHHAALRVSSISNERLQYDVEALVDVFAPARYRVVKITHSYSEMVL